MNELFFNWRKSLNIKKIAIVIIIIITFILLIFLLIFLKKENIPQDPKAPIYHAETNTTTFFDENLSISLELSNILELKQYTPSQDYLIELRSSTNLNVFVSCMNIIEGKNLNEVILADKIAFTEEFDTVSNISEIKKISIKEHIGYTYSFNYLDQALNTNFFIQVAWFEINGNYYIFDVEFPLDDLNEYISVLTNVLSNFEILQ